MEMSRTREGKDSQPNIEPQEETTQTAGQTTDSQIDERLGARGQTDYTPGRESRRDFPRRSTSLRERGEGYSQHRGAHKPQSRQNYGRYSGYDYQNRGEERSRYRATTPYARREETQEDFGGQSQQSGEYGRSSRYGSQSRTGEYRQEPYRRSNRDFDSENRYGRSSSGFGRRTSQMDEDRSFGADRSHDYERESTGFRAQREEYDEPYERETFGGRPWGYGQSYDPGRYDARLDYDRVEDDFEVEGRRGRDERGYGRRYLRCGDIMTKDVTVCSPQTVIRDVADKMDDDGVGSLPVVENGRLIGIITDRDIVCRVLADGRDTRSTFASDAMSDDVVTCTPDESVVEAIHKMGEHQIRRIPVCDTNGRLRGIIAMADVALEAENDREIANALEQISRPTPNRSRRV
jgi:CBS domain-containing protein